MADRKRKSSSLPIILNDDTRSWWADQGILAERTFQERREDRHAPSPKADEERRSLHRKLSVSCRKTAELLALYKRDNPGFTIPEVNTILKYSLIEVTDLAVALRPFWDEAEQSFGGVDKVLELFAQYFDILRKRPLGRRPDQALIGLIKAKLIAWTATHGDRSVCYWNSYKRKYEGAFLKEMKQILQRLDYKPQSDNALGERIEAVRGQIVVYASAEEAHQAMMKEAKKLLRKKARST